jgi:hypothetical protein
MLVCSSFFNNIASLMPSDSESPAGKDIQLADSTTNILSQSSPCKLRGTVPHFLIASTEPLAFDIARHTQPSFLLPRFSKRLKSVKSTAMSITRN